jgi:hypothetical protein
MADLEEIMAGRGSLPEAEPTTTHEQTPPAAEPQQAPPQQQEPQNPDPNANPNPDDDADPVTGLRKALDAERGKGRKYKETVEQFERRLEAMQERFEGFIQAFQAQQRPQQTPQQEQPPVEIWDDPGAFVGTQVQKALDPVQQALMFNARLVAESRHTPDKVNEAEQAFLAAVQSRELDPRDYYAVVNSPNRYHAAVEWYENRPEAQRSKLEAELRAQIMSELGIQPGQTPQAAQQQQPATAPQAMPTSFASQRNAGPRTTPQWTGPQPLSEIMKR